MLNLTNRWKHMVTHAPVPFIIGKNLWDLQGGRLDGIWIWFGHGSWWENPCPCLIMLSIITQFPNWPLMPHVGDEALLNRQSSRIEQFCGFQVWLNPLNAKLNPFCHLLTLSGAHYILHVSRLRVNWFCCVLLFPGCIWPCCEEWFENESDLYLATKVPWRTCFTRIYKPNCWLERPAASYSLVSVIFRLLHI
jgi:hypothetical protein